MQKNRIMAAMLAAILGMCTLSAAADTCIVQGPYGPITVTCGAPTQPPIIPPASPIYIPGQTCDYVMGPYGIIKLPACPK